MYFKKIVRGSLALRALNPEMMQYICNIFEGEAALNCIVIYCYCGNRALWSHSLRNCTVYWNTACFGSFTMRDVAHSNEELL